MTNPERFTVELADKATGEHIITGEFIESERGRREAKGWVLRWRTARKRRGQKISATYSTPAVAR